MFRTYLIKSDASLPYDEFRIEFGENKVYTTTRKERKRQAFGMGGMLF